MTEKIRINGPGNTTFVFAGNFYESWAEASSAFLSWFFMPDYYRAALGRPFRPTTEVRRVLVAVRDQRPSDEGFETAALSLSDAELQAAQAYYSRAIRSGKAPTLPELT